MRNRLAAVCGAFLVALLVVALWRLGSARDGSDGAADVAGSTEQDQPAPVGPTPGATTPVVSQTAAATASPAPTASLAPTAARRTPTRTAQPSPAPEDVPPPTVPPGAPPPPDTPALTGTAVRDDETGDLLDTAGTPPPEAQSAADLVEVRLAGDGDALTVEFTLAGAVPATAGSLVWSLDVWSGGTLAYTVTAQRVGARLVAGVLDWDSGEQVPPPQAPVVDGASVSLAVPRALLGRIDGPFQWQAVGQADGGYEDYVPADGTLTWFPTRLEG